MTGADRQPADASQRRDALDASRSFIVQAPAGSGKTELLIQRMLKLLATVEQPEEVLAITFTRKAAAEMRNRLVTELQAAARDADGRELEPHKQLSRELARQVLEADRAGRWHLLLQPNRLQVRTIDSLCSELARRLPVLSGLGGGLGVAEQPETLYQRAAARTLAAIESEADPLHRHLVRVLDRYDNQLDRLQELVSGMLANRDQWLGHVLALRDAESFDRHGLEQALRLLVESQLAEALERTPAGLFGELDGLLRFARQHEPADLAQLDAMLDAGALALTAEVSDLASWQTLTRRLLTGDGKAWRKAVNKNDGFPAPSSATGDEAELYKATKERFVALLDTLQDDEALRAHYAAVRLLPEPAYDDEAWASLEALLHILLRAASEWAVVAAESGEVDYAEISARAVQALGEETEPTDLALSMDYRLSHLLVDEFQDTSSSQIALLQRLTGGWTAGDGHSLFLVGDPMQSIYRFRKAEVSLFIQAWEGRIFEQLALNPLRLSVNFRSCLPVVAWVNERFPAVMPQRSNHLLAAVRYSPADPGPRAGDNGSVSLDIGANRERVAEAQAMCDIIATAEPSESVAVLVRSRPHATELLAALDRLKESDPRFRYQAIDFFKLAETPLVRDLVSLTLALNQPADSLAWLSVLRAPFVGLDLADLERLAGGNPHGLLAEALARVHDPGGNPLSLSEDGRLRIQRVGPPLLRALDLRGRSPIRSIVETCWKRLGGPACLRSSAELADAQTYFALLEAMEAEGVMVDRDSLDLRLQRLFARPDPGADGRLKIMTIYAAKGLEFDRVIVPGLDRRPARDPGKLVYWFELAGTEHIVMSPMRNAEDRANAARDGDLIQFISGTEGRRQQLEDGRLMYVAATRAIRHLHLLGSVTPRADRSVGPAAGSLLSVLWPAIQADVHASLQPGADNGEAADGDPATGLPQVQWRLGARWILPDPPAPVAGPAPAAEEPAEPVEFSWAGEGARLAGVLVHRLLQQVGKFGIAKWESRGGTDAALPWCRGQLAARGIEGKAADRILERVGAAVNHCLSTKQGQWVLADHAEAECELAVTALIDGRPQNVVIDRSFLDGGERWIIDYKTSTHAGGDLEGFLASEIERYTPQLRRYRQAFDEPGGQPVRTALYYPLLDRLCEVA